MITETVRSCSPDTLRALRERVAAATGPDRETDARLWCLFNSGKYELRFERLKNQEGFVYSQWEDGKPIEWLQSRGHQFAAHEKVCESIDAAIGLVERCLPGWWWHLSWDAACELLHPDDELEEPNAGHRNVVVLHMSGRPALAIILALLDALLASQDSTRD